MDLAAWAFILFGISAVLLLAELFIPSHGLLGIAGTGAMVACIVCCFQINQYLGLGVMLATLVAAPFVATAAMKVWPRTPVGRRMVLQPVESRLQPPLVRIGDEGVALSELRPMGTCEFPGGERLEVRSELGMIPPQTRVRVVNIESGRLIVRPAAVAPGSPAISPASTGGQDRLT